MEFYKFCPQIVAKFVCFLPPLRKVENLHFLLFSTKTQQILEKDGH